MRGENSADENAGEEKVPTMTVKIDKTTYVVGVHFSKPSKETLKDKLKRMILEEAKTYKFTWIGCTCHPMWAWNVLFVLSGAYETADPDIASPFSHFCSGRTTSVCRGRSLP